MYYYYIILSYTVHVYAEAVCAFVRGDCVCTYVHAHVCVYVRAHIRTCARARVRTRVRACEGVHVHEPLHVRVCARFQLRVRACALEAANHWHCS